MASKLNFYGGYGDFKGYQTPDLREKHIAQFDREFWKISGCTSDMSVLEIGCGAGQFLRYLAHKEVQFFRVWTRTRTSAHTSIKMSLEILVVSDAFEYFADLGTGDDYNRVVMFDVFEHFSVEDGAKLLPQSSRTWRQTGKLLSEHQICHLPWGGNINMAI